MFKVVRFMFDLNSSYPIKMRVEPDDKKNYIQFQKIASV